MVIGLQRWLHHEITMLRQTLPVHHLDAQHSHLRVVDDGCRMIAHTSPECSRGLLSYIKQVAFRDPCC